MSAKKILILQGSPHRRGSTAILVEEFARGAAEAGHEVERVDVAYAKVAPCLGCMKCGLDGPCVQHDDMDGLRERIMAADMLVLATPIYYFGMTAQLKVVLDRLLSVNDRIQRAGLDAALLTLGADEDADTFDAILAHYRKACEYLHLRDRGHVTGFGCGNPAATRASEAPRQAYELGRSLG